LAQVVAAFSHELSVAEDMKGRLIERAFELLDVAEDQGVLRHSLNAHTASCGGLGELARRGHQSLMDVVAEVLYARGVRSPKEEARLLTQDEKLMLVFSVLDLDSRLRNHPRPLGGRLEADIVRAMVAELNNIRDTKVGQAAWPRELVRVLANLLLEVVANIPVVLADAEVEADIKLTALLRSGSARAIAARMQDLHRSSDPHARGALRAAVLQVMPELAPMRLLVFAQLLHSLCCGTSNPRVPVSSHHRSLVAEVVQAVLDSDIEELPCRDQTQLSELLQSVCLAEEHRAGLATMLVSNGSEAALGRRSLDGKQLAWQDLDDPLSIQGQAIRKSPATYLRPRSSMQMPRQASPPRRFRTPSLVVRPSGEASPPLKAPSSPQLRPMSAPMSASGPAAAYRRAESPPGISLDWAAERFRRMVAEAEWSTQPSPPLSMAR